MSPQATAAMVALGYGKYARADRIYALIPLEGPQRGDGRRTLVYVDGIEQPLTASRSEGAIAGDVSSSLDLDGPRARRKGTQSPGQDPLF